MELLQELEPKVMSSMNRELIKDVSEVEIYRALKAIKLDSAPGIDVMRGKKIIRIGKTLERK